MNDTHFWISDETPVTNDIAGYVALTYRDILSDDIIEALKLDGRWPLEEDDV